MIIVPDGSGDWRELRQSTFAIWCHAQAVLEKTFEFTWLSLFITFMFIQT